MVFTLISVGFSFSLLDTLLFFSVMLVNGWHELFAFGGFIVQVYECMPTLNPN